MIIKIGISTQPRYFVKYSIPVITDIFDVVITWPLEFVRISSSDVWKYCDGESIILENIDVSGLTYSSCNTNGNNTIVNIIIAQRYFGNLNFSFFL